MDATCKIQDGIHMPRIIKKCVQDSGYISPGGFFIVALPHPCNKLHTIKLEEKENLKNLYVTEQQIVRFAWFVLMFGKSIFRPTFDS